MRAAEEDTEQTQASLSALDEDTCQMAIAVAIARAIAVHGRRLNVESKRVSVRS